MPSKDHETRRKTLKALLKKAPAATQQSLVTMLQKAGFTATQSSVSRDLRELGAFKTQKGYQLQSVAKTEDNLLADVAALIRGLKPAGPNLLVIKTGIGAAQRVALALDRSDWPEVVGNIGGDDTIFVATESGNAQKNLITRIEHSARF